jgi:integrase
LHDSDEKLALGVQRLNVFFFKPDLDIFLFAEPKTKAGRRSIPLTDATVSILDQQRKEQVRQRISVGAAWLGGQPGMGDMPVFATEVGTYYDRNNLDRTLRACLKAANLPTMGLHALRHTFATLWAHSGVDLKNLSETLGHTKVAFTLQQYVHSDMETKRAGMLAVGEVM